MTVPTPDPTPDPSADQAVAPSAQQPPFGGSDNSELRHEEEDEAVQAVVDRVLSWQAGAPEETVRAELEDGLGKVGVTRPEEWLRSNAAAISKADPAQS